MRRIAMTLLALTMVLSITTTALAAEEDMIVFYDPAQQSQPQTDSQPATQDSGAVTAATGENTVELTISQQYLLDSINEERAKAGLGPVEVTQLIQDAAMARARELVELYSHTRPDGRSCFSVLYDAGISENTWVGENIAEGQPTAMAVMSRWMNSQGHKDNILGEKFHYVGLGHVTVDGRSRWVMLFMS